MHSDVTKEQLSLASSLIDVDINEAIKSFNDFKTKCRVYEKENIFSIDQRRWMNGMMKSVGLLEKKKKKKKKRLRSYYINFVNH